jgi:hypothetical protein
MKENNNYMAVKLFRFESDIGMLPVSWLSERKLHSKKQKKIISSFNHKYLNELHKFFLNKELHKGNIQIPQCNR